MDLMDIAMTVFLPISLSLFIFGFVYRVSRFAFMPSGRGFHAPSRFTPERKARFPKVFFETMMKFSSTDIPRTVFAGIIMHVTILLLFFLYRPHQEVYGWIIWPVMPLLKALSFGSSPVALDPVSFVINGDLITIVGIFGVVAIFIYDLALNRYYCRLNLLDYIVLLIILGTLVSGYITTHRLIEYTTALGIHVSFGLLLLALFPFSKLSHSIFHFWANKIRKGVDRGRRGLI